MEIGSSQPGILGTVGNTPLVKLHRFLDRDDIDLWAKLEMENPGGSSKDRPAVRMLSQAMQDGRIQSGGLVVESSSGNTGIAMAQFCNWHGLRFRCVVDRHIQAQNLAILRAYGAEIECVDDPGPGAGDLLSARFRRVEEIVRSTRGAYWPNQHANPDNPRAHELGTMPEILDELEGDLDYLFVALSTTGTALGCQRCLRRRGYGTRVVAVDVEGSALSGGPVRERPIPGFGAGKAGHRTRPATPGFCRGTSVRAPPHARCRTVRGPPPAASVRSADSPDARPPIRRRRGCRDNESDIIMSRLLHFPRGVAVGDAVIFPNTAGYYMHFVESRSHQIPLPRNVVLAPDQ